jgi:hypothetical protein
MLPLASYTSPLMASHATSHHCHHQANGTSCNPPNKVFPSGYADLEVHPADPGPFKDIFDGEKFRKIPNVQKFAIFQISRQASRRGAPELKHGCNF